MLGLDYVALLSFTDQIPHDAIDDDAGYVLCPGADEEIGLSCVDPMGGVSPAPH